MEYILSGCSFQAAGNGLLMAVRQDASTGEMVDDGNAEATKTAAVNDDDLLMKVKIYSPSKVYFEGDAKSISAASETGPFDILPKHHNFITLLVACNLVVRSPSGDQTIQIANGLMHVKADQITVFLDV
jgi:hypothetical protein